MTVSPDTFHRKDKPASGRTYYEYPVLRAGMYRFEVVSITDLESKKKGRAEYGNKVIRVKARLLVAGAENATTAAEIDAFKRKNHGRIFHLDVQPVVSPPGRNAKGVTNASTLYEIIRVLCNDGEALTDWQLGRDAETAALPHAQRLYQAGSRTSAMLQELVDTKVQFDGMVTQFVFDDGHKDNFLREIVSRIPDEEKYPAYQPFERPRDPREDEDDISVECSITGLPLRGWEGKEGWVTNTEWAVMQRDFFGDWMYRKGMDSYAAPFGPQHYRDAKAAFVRERNGEDLPF